MNRLANGQSPYLLQHASKPVDWWPWGEEAMQEAQRRDVPARRSRCRTRVVSGINLLLHKCAKLLRQDQHDVMWKTDGDGQPRQTVVPEETN